MLEQIRATGYARVRLNASETDRLARLHQQANRFFAAGPAHNLRYSNDRLTNGYRPPHAAYNNGDPVNEADDNDSFLYWNPAHSRKIPHHSEIPDFLDALEQHRDGAARRVMTALMDELAAHYRYPHELPFEEASVLQVNSFGEPGRRDLLQTPHEDGVLATVIWTSAPGLEALVGGETIPLTTGPDEVLVMPGGILTAMTGGEIPPLIHQARNHGAQTSLGRKSVMYFSCPDIDKGPISPYVPDDTYSDLDIRDAIRTATDAFGLAADFVLDH
ncbi:2OG-Fe(II) oxygenase family protein [Nocardia farcinica]|uniref:2OG-Fe(II) oxygenase family protein n=1 Tax=Nocardia farcinica TaxID=37329 RepID=UPI0024555B9E|nr:2OG-Fe(II) oxygenase family protein [Nocardia farcinica]